MTTQDGESIADKPIILGTAGHIDHGKTTLIRALTGVNTDRLKEERRRGITIELGFAALALPGIGRLGVVDVPGHERFVKHMVAGATGIDIVALVVAADEGVMPQTREHMEICALLGVHHGLVVLTKIDLVDEELRELVLDDVETYLRGSFLEGCPIVPVSGVTGEGIPELVRTLGKMSAAVPERSTAGMFRLPVDRVFTMRGFGTVVTGTVASGQIRAGDKVRLYPGDTVGRVRGIQCHGESVSEVRAGMRAAINFQGLEREAVNRGDVLSTPGALAPGFMVDVDLRYLAGNPRPIRNRTQVRFHAGTSEILGNLILLDRDELAPGETALAQLRLEAPAALVAGDRFVIRSYSPVRTIGGGAVLNPIPPKHKRFRESVIARLAERAEAGPLAAVEGHVRDAGYGGRSLAHLRVMTNLPEKELESALQDLASSRRVIQTDRERRIYVHGDPFQALVESVANQLAAYHRERPLKPGMSMEELRSKFPPEVGQKLFTQVLNRLVKEERLAREGDLIRSADHAVALGVDESELRGRLLETYRSAGLTPPNFSALCREMGVAPKAAESVMMTLRNEGRVVKVTDDLFFHAEALADLRERVAAFLREKGEMTTPDFKTIAGVSRKYLIPLIEHLDAENLTIRVGEVRKLRSG
ncbi:MAG: selenocysteine-specific translation elongation factor [Desulfococcaceae bacterium]